ncbi:MAG: sigma-70 family RNA polymerase sigma factor [Clostridiales bacterium]|nr:sigma-70 family RNA polymerase sigma factor [Clostridiales bacterium]
MLFIGQAGASTTSISEDISLTAARLMDTYGNQILRFAYSYVHNMEDAEDILQETLISYMKTAPVFENERHEKSWLFTVTANHSKNKIKSNNIRRADELNEELVAEKKEDLSFIWEAVKNLPDDYREVIHLFYEEDLTTAQIAQVLKRRESTVRSQLKRGRDKLKDILKENYDFG